VHEVHGPHPVRFGGSVPAAAVWPGVAD
jgi:hypothetical protein